MWEVRYIVSKSSGGKSHRLASLKIVGGDELKRTYIYCTWVKKKVGNQVKKVTGVIKRKSFDKKKYRGDERLAKYIKKYFGPGKYTIMRPLGGRRGTKSVFYGMIEKHYFARYKRYNEILLNDTGMSPHLTSTKPVGEKHEYQ